MCFGLQLETHFIMARKEWEQEWVKLWQQECGSHCVSIVRKQNVGTIVSTIRKQNVGTIVFIVRRQNESPIVSTVRKQNMGTTAL